MYFEDRPVIFLHIINAIFLAAAICTLLPRIIYKEQPVESIKAEALVYAENVDLYDDCLPNGTNFESHRNHWLIADRNMLYIKRKDTSKISPFSKNSEMRKRECAERYKQELKEYIKKANANYAKIRKDKPKIVKYTVSID